ncbi:glycosyltransferase family 25 protein [Photobacterium sp.]|uniref:glycosyltransferase family 25 protein n=1 Tax=Photobacterium sp. TaxID=660 RepID=UPI00299DBE66|nr:glycosyltransferase family 25 protein [Photobacterium sp.]MDX1302644.1 glycosyltransferase family 25 protein [Photobacterium sp.]
MIDIFVINLESSTDRRAHISKQLDELGVNYHIFSAINGHKGHHPLFDMYDDGLSQLYRGKSLSKGQIGCYASHYQLWQQCIELNKPIIVIEDDALIYPKAFKAFIQHLPQLEDNYECIRLFDNKRKCFSFNPVKQLDSITICKFSKGHMSATGYFITPAGATKMLKHSTRWYMAVDIYMDRFWINDVECYGTSPACLTNDPIFESDIGYGKKAPRSFLTRCKREWFNLTELIKREIHNLRFKINNNNK